MRRYKRCPKCGMRNGSWACACSHCHYRFFATEEDLRYPETN